MGQASSVAGDAKAAPTGDAASAPPPPAHRVIHWRTTAPRAPTPPSSYPADVCPSSSSSPGAAAPPCGPSPASARPRPPQSPQSPPADTDAAVPVPIFASPSTPLAVVLVLLDKAAGDPDAPELRPFTKLQVLDLHCNALPAIPVQLKLCAANLRTLILHSNDLTSLPDEVVCLGGLHTLDVHDNKIVRLPERLADLRDLKYLDVSRNALACLPPDFDALAERLDRLYLHGNPLAGEDGVAVAAWCETVERAELVAFRARRGGPPSPDKPAVNFDAIQRATGAPLAGISGRPSPRGRRAPPSKANLEARRADGKPNAHGLELDLESDLSDDTHEADATAAARTPVPARAASADVLAPPAPSSAAAGLAGIMKSGLAGSMPTLRRIPSGKSEAKENGVGPAADGKDGATAAPPDQNKDGATAPPSVQTKDGAAAPPPGQKKTGDAKTLPSPASPGAGPKKNAVTLPKLNPTAPGSAAPAEDAIPPWKRELMERKAKAAAAAAAGNAAK